MCSHNLIAVMLISNNFYRKNLLPDTHEVFDELRAGGADVLNSVEDVHLLLHLHVFEHVAGCKQQMRRGTDREN